jgi:hypothetical protein
MRKFFGSSLLGLSLALAALPAIAQDSFKAQEQRREAFERLSGLQPGIMTNVSSGVLDRIYGPPFGGGATARESFESFVRTFDGVFGLGDARLVYQGAQMLGHNAFIAGTFQEFYGDYPVDRGQVTLLVKNQIGYPLVLAVTGAKTVEGPIAPPRISASAAINLLKKHHPTLRDFAKPSLAIWMGETRGHLAWTFLASSPTSRTGCTTCGSVPEAVQAFVDAHSGEILEERDMIYTLDVNGNVSGWATPGLKPDQASNPETLQPLHHLVVNISGGNSAETNASGNYTISHGGAAQVTVNAPLSGPWARVVNQAGATESLSQNVTPPGPADFIFNTSMAEFNTAQTNGFIHTNRIHDFVKAFNPTYPGIDIQIPVNVNVSGSCNAFFTTQGGPSINFYRASTTPNSCPNMAYSTVVYHEYGHFVVNRGGTNQGAYGEGMGDALACLLGDTPWTGEDFRGPGTGPLRSAINSVTFPSTAEIHEAGNIVSGAFWGTVLQLDSSVGHATGLNLVRGWAINSILLHPPYVSPGMTVDVLTLDDNDADITNGTPHYNEIAAGFGAKGLFAPPIEWIRFVPVVRVPNFVDYNTSARRLQLVFDVVPHAGQVDPTSIKVYTRTSGTNFVSQPMTPGGGPNSFFALINTPVSGSVIEWFLEGKDTQGHVMRYPIDAPFNYFRSVVATSLVTLVEDTFAADAGWSVANNAVASGAWTRADPNPSTVNGLQANPANDSGDSGALCWFTGQAASGSSVGTADLDGGPTQLTSPIYNLAGSDAIIEYKRWFFNDDGDDGLTVEVSNDNGASWHLVETAAGLQNTWVQRSFRLGTYVPGTAQVRLRFSVSDNPNNSITEAAVDHIVIRRIVP